MDDLRVGEWVRSERRRMGLRQTDVAVLAGISDSTVSRVETGRFSELSVQAIRAVAAVVGVQVVLAARSRRAAAIERQIDWRHAALVDAVVASLTRKGWQTTVEYSFNHFGDRGSVDVLGWHADAKALLVVEVKSELRDVQATLHALDIKRRIVPKLVREDRGWAASSLGVVMVLADLRVERQRIARHLPTFDVSLPARTVEVRQWLARPAGPLRGIWFLPFSRSMGGMQRRPGHGPIRGPGVANAAARAPKTAAHGRLLAPHRTS